MSARARGVVFFDRDGTLIEGRVVDGRPRPIQSVEELVLENGAEEACAALLAAGFPLVVVTNQPDIARRTQTRARVDQIHERLLELLPLDEIVVCPHDDADDCPCRKPRPGMLLDSAARGGFDLRASYMVGDRWRDVEAGQRAGCTTVFLDRKYSENVPIGPDMTVENLREATAWILARSSA